MNGDSSTLSSTRRPAVHQKPHWFAATVTVLTSLPKVIWEDGRVAALSHAYAVKSPMVTMAHPKFAPKSTPFRGPIPKPHYLPDPWTRPTYGSKRHPDPIRRIATMHWTDRQTHARTCTQVRTYVRTDRPTDRPWESLTTIGRCATRATRPNNVAKLDMLISNSPTNDNSSSVKCKMWYINGSMSAPVTVWRDALKTVQFNSTCWVYTDV